MEYNDINFQLHYIREMQNNSLSPVLLRFALSSLSAGDDHIGSSSSSGDQRM